MIVAGLQVFEEIDFIKACIKSCCNIFDQVVVFEGSWDTTAKIKGKRSSDGTIEEIEKLCESYNNLELLFYNGKHQVDHRCAIWNYCKKYKPDWYLQGDGDEIFHEKDSTNIKNTLSSYGPLNSLAPQHYLFWNDLRHYEIWNTAGARFFNVSNLDFTKVSIANCNNMNYDGKRFERNITDNFFIYHPSYVKNENRQILKIKHRTQDDKRKFPHRLVEGKMHREGRGKEWIDTLNIMKNEDLPKYLQEHI